MFHGLLLLVSLLGVGADRPAGEDLRAEVDRLVRLLDAPQLERREAAEMGGIGGQHGPGPGSVARHHPPHRLPAEQVQVEMPGQQLGFQPRRAVAEQGPAPQQVA